MGRQALTAAAAVAIAALVAPTGAGAATDPSRHARQTPGVVTAHVTDRRHDMVYFGPSGTTRHVTGPMDMHGFTITVHRTGDRPFLKAVVQVRRVERSDARRIHQLYLWFYDEYSFTEVDATVGRHRLASISSISAGDVACPHGRVTWSFRDDTVTVRIPLACLRRADLKSAGISLTTADRRTSGDRRYGRTDESRETRILPLTPR